jgi:hypothetical protein
MPLIDTGTDTPIDTPQTLSCQGFDPYCILVSLFFSVTLKESLKGKINREYIINRDKG